MEKTIYLIGGSGFIGSCLANKLSKNKSLKFKIIDKKTSKYYPKLCTIVDIRNYSALEGSLSTNSLLIHLAAEHRDNVKPVNLYYDVNVTGAHNLCNVARKMDINKIIFTSSVAVYEKSNTKINESSNLKPFNHYGKSKLQAEKIFMKWQLEDPFRRVLVIVRPTDVFGEGNRGNVYNLMRQIYLKRFVMVGRGSNIKSLAYVQNLADFILYTMKVKSGIHIYNYADNPDLSVMEFINIIKKELGQQKTDIHIPSLIAYILGYIADLFSLLLGKEMVLSSARVKKFTMPTIFSRKKNGEFKPHFDLIRAIRKTVSYEFKKK